MNAIILAAGFGTRLKPWTESHPKALVPVEEVPMLQRVIENLSKQGFNKIVVNIHHFGNQIIEFLNNFKTESKIIISDERDEILDTGGGIVKAIDLFDNEEPVLVHNVDIISNANLNRLMDKHKENNCDISLLVSNRDSTRRLFFDKNMILKGWINKETGEIKPHPIRYNEYFNEYAFSGIYIINRKAVKEIPQIVNKKKFPIMDYFLNPNKGTEIKGVLDPELILLDIGKPATLAQAPDILTKINCAPL